MASFGQEGEITADAMKPISFFVPGRIEFLGKHTDYAGGRSLFCAIDRGIRIKAIPRRDATINITCAAGNASFPLDPEIVPRMGEWTNYPMTVARRLARNFPGIVGGADISFTSDLPISSGLSSSSAIVVAFYLVLSEINRLQDRAEYSASIQTPEDLSGYLGTIENGRTFASLAGDRGVGTFGGSEDHTAILYSRPGQLVQYSFCPVKHERTVPLPADHVLVIGVSGVVAEKTGTARSHYNNASLLVTSIMSEWFKATGRKDATLADIVADADLRRRLREVIGEQSRQSNSKALPDRLEQFTAESTEIIPAAADALAHGRTAELGAIVDRSQELSATLLKNQVPETVNLARAARQCGAAAASAFGAGFGGSVWALVLKDDAGKFIADWRERYVANFPNAGARSEFFQANACAGVLV